jgi:hypothetical protein
MTGDVVGLINRWFIGLAVKMDTLMIRDKQADKHTPSIKILNAVYQGDRPKSLRRVCY